MTAAMTSTHQLAALLCVATVIGCGRTETHPGAADGAFGDTDAPAELPVQQPAPQVEIEAGADDMPAPSGGAPGSGAPGSSNPGTAEPGLRGTVVVSGTANDPFTTLQVESGAPLRVTGPLEPELRSLSGAVVLVRGPRTAGMPGSVRADSYEILEIGGRRAWTGTVLPDGRLASGADTLYLSGGTSDIRPGQRIWVTGGRSGNQLRVASWGAIAR
jgi:hypothetical protein